MGESGRNFLSENVDIHSIVLKLRNPSVKFGDTLSWKGVNVEKEKAIRDL